jgi:hypothetical protein
MSGLTFWTGPVSIQQTERAVVPGTTHKVIECSGATKLPYCRDVSAGLYDADGRRLPRLLAELHAEGDDPIILSAFSAGGRLVRDIVSHPLDRQMVRAVMLSDATYSDGPGADGRPILSPDIVSLASYAANPANGLLLVATSSPSPNGSRPTGVQTLSEIQRQTEIAMGESFVAVPDFYGISPAPDEAVRLGNAIFARYPLAPLHHGGHVELATETFSKILVPWLASGGELPGDSGGGGGNGGSGWVVPLGLAALAAGVAGGYAAGRRLRSGHG